MRVDSIPIWFVFIGTIIVVMIAIEVGYRLGQMFHRWSEDEKESPVSVMAGAILGLSSFMLTFTFGIVSERHDAKKALVRDEAIAIGTAWKRADFLPEPDLSEAKDLLRQYVDVRVAFVHAGNVDQERVKSVVSETQRIQDRLWDMAVANARKDMNSDVAALYIDALNELNAVHVPRLAVGIQRLAPEIWLVLYGITNLGMIGVGYQTGIAGSKRTMAGPLLALSFALAFALIASIDRPDIAVLKVTQQPLTDVRSLMK